MLSNSEKKNAIWNSGSFVVSSILGFVNFTLNFNSFPSEVFGLFILINAVFGIGYTLDFGFGVSTIKHIAEALKKEDYDLLNKTFVSFFFAFFILAIFVFCGFMLYYFLFFTKTELFLNGDQSTIYFIYIFLALTFLFRYLGSYVSKVFEGFSEFSLLSIINIAVGLINTLSIFFIFIFKLDILYLALFLFFNAVLLFLTLTIIGLTKIDHLKFRFRYFDFKILKHYGVYNMNIQFAFFVGSLVDPLIKFIIGNSFSLNFVTYYESAKKIIDLSNGLIFSSQKEVFVKLSHSNVANNLKEFVNEKIFIYSKLANYYSILVYGILNPVICVFLLLWIKQYEPIYLFLIFLPAYSLINIGGSLYSVLMVEGKGGKLVLIQTLNVIFTAFFLYTSIHITNSYLGLYGFYLSIVINTILLLYFMVQDYTLRLKDFLSKIHFVKLIILNLLLISQSILLQLYIQYLYYILSVYLIVYFVIFNKIFFVMFSKVKEKLINLIKTRKLIG